MKLTVVMETFRNLFIYTILRLAHSYIRIGSTIYHKRTQTLKKINILIIVLTTPFAHKYFT